MATRPHSTLDSRYAQALYEEAEGQGRVDDVDADVALLRESLEGSHDLRRFFESPIIPADKKAAIVDELFARRVSEVTLRYMKFLLSKKREEMLPTIAMAYRALRDEQLGILEAYARAARPLDEAARAKLRETLAGMTGKDIRLHVEIDPSLLGGLIVRVGDRVYDGSVEHKLDTLRERMEEGRALVEGAA